MTRCDGCGAPLADTGLDDPCARVALDGSYYCPDLYDWCEACADGKEHPHFAVA